MALGIKRSAILCKVLESRLGLNCTVFGRKNLHFASIFNMPIKVMNRIRITFHLTNILKFIILLFSAEINYQVWICMKIHLPQKLILQR